ncbi:MAG: ASCH domain-containing protein [Leptolyngbyaceae cyanobacterium]
MLTKNPPRPAGTPPERGEEMRIITLWQPWASLIAFGVKRFETRSWGTQYRGKLAIHAAKRPMRGEFESLSKKVKETTGKSLEYHAFRNCYWSDPFPLGRIVAICNLSNCYQMVDTSKDDPRIDVENPIYLFTKNGPLETLLGHWESGRFAWELSDVMELAEPIPYRGGQGLRRLDDHATLMSIAARLPMGGGV